MFTELGAQDKHKLNNKLTINKYQHGKGFYMWLLWLPIRPYLTSDLL